MKEWPIQLLKNKVQTIRTLSVSLSFGPDGSVVERFASGAGGRGFERQPRELLVPF